MTNCVEMDSQRYIGIKIQYLERWRKRKTKERKRKTKERKKDWEVVREFEEGMFIEVWKDEEEEYLEPTV